MAKVIPLPQPKDGALAIPLADGALLRLLPCRESPHVLMALYGPRGGNAGGVVLHAERAALLGTWLHRLAAHFGVREDPMSGSRDGVAGLLDGEAVGRTLASLAVPAFADWWAIEVLARKGTMRRLA